MKHSATCVQIWARPKSTEVASRRKRVAKRNASSKLASTCESVWPGLTNSRVLLYLNIERWRVLYLFIDTFKVDDDDDYDRSIVTHKLACSSIDGQSPWFYNNNNTNVSLNFALLSQSHFFYKKNILMGVNTISHTNKYVQNAYQKSTAPLQY